MKLEAQRTVQTAAVHVPALQWFDIAEASQGAGSSGSTSPLLLFLRRLAGEEEWPPELEGPPRRPQKSPLLKWIHAQTNHPSERAPRPALPPRNGIKHRLQQWLREMLAAASPPVDRGSADSDNLAARRGAAAGLGGPLLASAGHDGPARSAAKPSDAILPLAAALLLLASSDVALRAGVNPFFALRTLAARAAGLLGVASAQAVHAAGGALHRARQRIEALSRNQQLRRHLRRRWRPYALVLASAAAVHFGSRTRGSRPPRPAAKPPAQPADGDLALPIAAAGIACVEGCLRAINTPLGQRAVARVRMAAAAGTACAGEHVRAAASHIRACWADFGAAAVLVLAAEALARRFPADSSAAAVAAAPHRVSQRALFVAATSCFAAERVIRRNVDVPAVARAAKRRVLKLTNGVAERARPCAMDVAAHVQARRRTFAGALAAWLLLGSFDRAASAGATFPTFLVKAGTYGPALPVAVALCAAAHYAVDHTAVVSERAHAAAAKARAAALKSAQASRRAAHTAALRTRRTWSKHVGARVDTGLRATRSWCVAARRRGDNDTLGHTARVRRRQAAVRVASGVAALGLLRALRRGPSASAPDGADGPDEAAAEKAVRPPARTAPPGDLLPVALALCATSHAVVESQRRRGEAGERGRGGRIPSHFTAKDVVLAVQGLVERVQRQGARAVSAVRQGGLALQSRVRELRTRPAHLPSFALTMDAREYNAGNPDWLVFPLAQAGLIPHALLRAKGIAERLPAQKAANGAKCEALLAVEDRLSALLTDLPSEVDGDLRALFELDFDQACYLNHGSYGATLKVARQSADVWRAYMESQPSRFFEDSAVFALIDSLSKLARLLNADVCDVAPIANATSGLTTALASLPLRRGDAVLVLDVTYPAVKYATAAAAAAAGASVVEVQTGVECIVQPLRLVERVNAVLAGAGGRIKAAVFDHVVSFPPVVLPVAQLAQACRKNNALAIIDGAHAIGNIPLDIPSLGADIYVTNCHKWLCTGKGTAVLWATKEMQAVLKPRVVSHGAGLGFVAEFWWSGTQDLCHWLAVPAAIEVFERLGGVGAVHDRNARVLQRGVEVLVAAFGLKWPLDGSKPPLVLGCNATSPRIDGQRPSLASRRPGEPQPVELARHVAFFRGASMAAVQLPTLEHYPPSVTSALALRRHLRAQFGVEAPVAFYLDVLWVRVSAQLYTDVDDFVALAAAVCRMARLPVARRLVTRQRSDGAHAIFRSRRLGADAGESPRPSAALYGDPATPSSAEPGGSLPTVPEVTPADIQAAVATNEQGASHGTQQNPLFNDVASTSSSSAPSSTAGLAAGRHAGSDAVESDLKVYAGLEAGLSGTQPSSSSASSQSAPSTSSTSSQALQARPEAARQPPGASLLTASSHPDDRPLWASGGASAGHFLARSASRSSPQPTATPTPAPAQPSTALHAAAGLRRHTPLSPEESSAPPVPEVSEAATASSAHVHQSTVDEAESALTGAKELPDAASSPAERTAADSEKFDEQTPRVSPAAPEAVDSAAADEVPLRSEMVEAPVRGAEAGLRDHQPPADDVAGAARAAAEPSTHDAVPVGKGSAAHKGGARLLRLQLSALRPDDSAMVAHHRYDGACSSSSSSSSPPPEARVSEDSVATPSESVQHSETPTRWRAVETHV